MTIKTILWFTFGGTFSALYANKLRGHHFLRKPQYNLLATAIGFAVGYKMHQLEESYVEKLEQTKRENPHAPIYPRESLLTYQAMIRRKQSDEPIGDADNESFDITEEEEED